MIRTNTEYIQTWYLLVDTLHDLELKRNEIEKSPQKTDFKIAAINASMIIHIAAIVEGSISSLLINRIENNEGYKKAKRNDDGEVIRIFDKLLDEVYKSTWSLLSKEISLTVLDFSLSSVGKNWQAIKYLFEFRNLLAHGGSVVKKTKMKSKGATIVGLDKVDVSITEKLTKDELFNFLSEKQLIDFPKGEKILGWNVINSKVTDYFKDNAKLFLIGVYSKCSEFHKMNSFLENDLRFIKKSF
jgi:hypothetical protein